MRTWIWCEFVCATCAQAGGGGYTLGAVNRVQMRANAQAQGWHFYGFEAYCSKACLDRAKAQQAADERGTT